MLLHPVGDPLGEIPRPDEQPSRILALPGPMDRIVRTLKLEIVTLEAGEALPPIGEANFKAFRVAGAQDASFHLTWPIYHSRWNRVQHNTPPESTVTYYVGKRYPVLELNFIGICGKGHYFNIPENRILQSSSTIASG